ncbi:hypothetical protein HPB47_017793 [Ixodes persulcatus]|uniref:Uncharacterized protein n=1 Tax=Ixodes persulcatus TaxID=34615 RepID=A0AC60QN81_IXOPE|nr:hypothetical protein HPB47_017793 [Ixodes persulcatus]
MCYFFIKNCKPDLLISIFLSFLNSDGFILQQHAHGSVRYINSSDSPDRTTEGVLRDMALGLQCSVPINGYEGPSPTVKLPHFDLVWGFTVDYMHAVLLGASEWRHWLLFYSLPCTLDVLPQQYWAHLKQLVEAVHILLSDQLTQLSIDRADTLLKLFVADTQRLYGATAMTFNVHQMLHLAEVARRLGPLWAHSAFVFESGNGRLVKLVTGASGASLQIVERVVMSKQLECFLSSSLVSQHIGSLCREMLGYAKLEHFLFAGDVCLLGHAKQLETPQEVQADFAGQSCPGICVEYSRLVYRRQIFYSTAYKRATKSDSSVIETNEGDVFVITKIISLTAARPPLQYAISDSGGCA